jgi:uncharacterized protein (TIGR02246 family)
MPDAGTSQAARDILAEERRALEQWAKGNPVGFAESFAQDATYFDDIAAHTRIDGLGALEAYMASLTGKIPPHRQKIVDPKVQLYGDVGILTLRYDVLGEDGTPVARWKATSVYHREDDGWRVVHAHWSTVKDS